jgi:hypothetical protein
MALGLASAGTQRVSLIDEQDGRPLAPGGRFDRGERLRDQMAHLADLADAANPVAEFEQRALEAVDTAQRVGGGLGEGGLAGADIAMHDHERVAVVHRCQERHLVSVEARRPRRQSLGVE